MIGHVTHQQKRIPNFEKDLQTLNLRDLVPLQDESDWSKYQQYLYERRTRFRIYAQHNIDITRDIKSHHYCLLLNTDVVSDPLLFHESQLNPLLRLCII